MSHRIISVPFSPSFLLSKRGFFYRYPDLLPFPAKKMLLTFILPFIWSGALFTFMVHIGGGIDLPLQFPHGKLGIVKIYLRIFAYSM